VYLCMVWCFWHRKRKNLWRGWFAALERKEIFQQLGLFIPGRYNAMPPLIVLVIVSVAS